MGNWTGAILPATGQGIAVDTIPGQSGTVEAQVVKLDQGSPTNSVPVQEGSALSTADDTGQLAALMWMMRALGNADSKGALNVDIQTFTGSLGLVTTVSTVTTVSNVAANAGVGIEQFKNPALTAYMTQIASCYVYS